MDQLYSVALYHQVWIDVEAQNEDEALTLAQNAIYDLELKEGKNIPQITICNIEYASHIEPTVYEYPNKEATYE